MNNGRFKRRRSFSRGYSSRDRFRRRGNFGRRIDINKFINKAKPIEEQTYEAQNSFADFQIDNQLKENVIKKGYKDPMPIQDQAIPILLKGQDLIGTANTGMGKTAAFLIPLINKALNDRSQKVLIITPTRELALQIHAELYSLTYRLGIFSVTCIGGANIRRQLSDLRRRHQFVIGTPGRLVDLTDRRALDLRSFNNIVIDEVDRMFDMGFIKDIKFLLDQLPESRQSLFFSATISGKIQTLIQNYSRNPVSISVKTRDTSDNVDQDVIRVNKSTKIETLHNLLIQEDFKKILIFGKTKHGVKRLAMDLEGRGFKAASIHGNKTQSQRQRALKEFSENRVNILVATDVVARGLDIPNVSHVINYDVPQTYDDYIHRIGRTGRAHNIGKALTFV